MILLICGSLFSCRQKNEDQSIVRSAKYKKSLKEAYQKLGLFYTSNYIPGLTVAVSINNQLVWADGFGYSNYELKVKASPSHKFRIGQVSQFITALTTVKLNEDGKILIDKPVTEYLSGITQKSTNYTIRQLGAHAAGIRQENVQAGKGNANTIETIIPSFINDDLIYEPGAYFLHTELGFDLIGYLLEKANKDNFAQLVKKTVIDTLKLTNTIQDNPYRITDNKSSQYDYDFIAQPTVATPIDLRGKEASAGYLSSVLDLVKMGNTLLTPGFFNQESINLLTTPYQLSSGQNSQFSFGLIVAKDNKGRTFYGQRGSVQGGCATLLIYPEDKLVIAIAGNIGNSSWELPVFEIAEIFQNQLHPELTTKHQDEPNEESRAPETK